MDPDYPIKEMLEAASKAKNAKEGFWAALKVLDKAGGCIMLPHEDGYTWRPDIPALIRRWKRR